MRSILTRVTTMREMTINPIEEKSFGAVITGIKLGDLSDEEFAQIHSAFLKFGFLLFPDQFLSEADNIAFGKRFGELEFGGAPMANQKRLEEGAYGEIIDLETQVMRTNVGNEAWHTDSTYKPLSSKCAMLSAVIVPDTGGETELADTRAAYAALDQATRDRIEHLSAYHSTQYSQANDFHVDLQSGLALVCVRLQSLLLFSVLLNQQASSHR